MFTTSKPIYSTFLRSAIDESLPGGWLEDIGRIRDCLAYFAAEGEEGVRSHLPRRNYRGSTEGEEGMRQSDEFVLDGRTSCGGSRGDAELTVNRTQMRISCARTDNEPFSDLEGSQSLRHEAQYFDFATGKAEGISPKGGG